MRAHFVWLWLFSFITYDTFSFSLFLFLFHSLMQCLTVWCLYVWFIYLVSSNSCHAEIQTRTRREPGLIAYVSGFIIALMGFVWKFYSNFSFIFKLFSSQLICYVCLFCSLRCTFVTIQYNSDAGLGEYFINNNWYLFPIVLFHWTSFFIHTFQMLSYSMLHWWMHGCASYMSQLPGLFRPLSTIN